MIAGLKQFAVRGRARGIKIIGGTVTPFENETFLPGAWNPRREAARPAVNEWLRQTDAFDAIVDFDRALRDPEHPTRMLAIYDCGDHVHPSDLGYRTMGDAIDLGLFDLSSTGVPDLRTAAPLDFDGPAGDGNACLVSASFDTPIRLEPEIVG